MEGGGGVAGGGGGCGLRQYFSSPNARALKPGGRPEGRCRRQSSGVSAHGSGALAPPLPASACPSRPRGDGRARRPALFVPPRGSGRARSGHRTAPQMAVRWQIRSSGSAAERQRERARGRRAAPLPWASVGGFRCREFGQCGVPRAVGVPVCTEQVGSRHRGRGGKTDALLYDCTSCAADQRIRYVCWATGSKSVLRGNTRYAGFRSVWQCGKRNYCVWQNSEKEVRAVSKDHKAKVIH